jgi:hypothetical protein
VDSANAFDGREILRKFLLPDVPSLNSPTKYISLLAKKMFMDQASIPNECKPYMIQIKRTFSGLNTNPIFATIFGFNDNYFLNNFGNDPLITVTSLVPNMPYARILSQSQSKPFRICAYQFSSQTQGQLEQTMLVNYFDANGRQCTDPIPPIYVDPYQYQSELVVFKFPTIVDGNTSITIPILSP